MHAGNSLKSREENFIIIGTRLVGLEIITLSRGVRDNIT